MAGRDTPPRGAIAEELQTERPTDARERTHDWTARNRDDAVSALRYTRFVSIIKRVLLLAAIALIVAVVAYSLQPRDSDHVSMTFEKLGSIANDLAMVKPRLNGTDSEGNPFVVTADSAVQDGKNARRAVLNNVEADMTMKSGGWLNANAERGLLDADKKTVDLTGKIAVFSDSGYEIHTASAHVDLAKGEVTGNTQVTGQGPYGTLRANGFRINRKTQEVKLVGNVHMTFYVHQGKTK